MTTATIEKSRELGEGNIVGSVVESPDKSAIASPLPFGPDEPVNPGIELDSLAAAAAAGIPAKIGRDGFWAGLKGRLVAFGDLVLGPPY